MRRKPLITVADNSYPFKSLGEAADSIKSSYGTDIKEICQKGTMRGTIVLADPQFMHELIAYYKAGSRHPDNYNENLSAIFGQIARAEEEDLRIYIPRFVSGFTPESRSKTAVMISEKDKLNLAKQLADFNNLLSGSDFSSIKEYGNLRHIGNTHSHPDLGGIGVNPSATDFETHSKHTDSKGCIWLTHIVDPIRQLSAFYAGPEMERVSVCYFLYPEDAEIIKYGFRGKAEAKKKASVRNSDTAPVLSPDMPKPKKKKGRKYKKRLKSRKKAQH